MNTANLQLEGLYLAVAAINNLLVRKGVLTREEVDLALRTAEATAIADDRLVEEFRPRQSRTRSPSRFASCSSPITARAAKAPYPSPSSPAWSAKPSRNITTSADVHRRGV